MKDTQKTINVLHLYAKDMNTYGDRGNVLVVKKRLEGYGFEPKVREYNPGDSFPDSVDIIVGGGGQDSGQSRIQKDLLQIGPKLKELAENGTPMLMICGLYQLFGHFFKTSRGIVIEGIGLLDIETHGGSERMIGNIHTKSREFGDIIGYENHSGQTFLGAGVEPLAQVVMGGGNNLTDSHEGVIYKNVIGTYLHGSLLPKNPQIADWLIKKAVINRYGRFKKQPMTDEITEKARRIALKLPR
jgi:lipid II isoglutaminyl synthase (glutamine-hydrolysing)